MKEEKYRYTKYNDLNTVWYENKQNSLRCLAMSRSHGRTERTGERIMNGKYAVDFHNHHKIARNGKTKVDAALPAYIYYISVLDLLMTGVVFPCMQD